MGISRILVHQISDSGSGSGFIPASNLLQGEAGGRLTGVHVLLVSGAAVTSIFPYAWNGQQFPASVVAEYDRVYEGAEITGAPIAASATESVQALRFDPRPFDKGLTPAVDVTATGAWTIELALHVELDAY